MVLRAFHALFALLFLFSIVVQFNDPDPIPWALVYGAALVLSLAALFGMPSRAASSSLLILAAIWAFAQLPSLGAFASRDLSTTRFEMHAGDLVEEEARECGGLLLVCFASIVQVMDANARRRGSLSAIAPLDSSEGASRGGQHT